MNGIIAQSGVVPCRIRRGRIEIALVTAGGGTRWTIPKGHVEPELSPQESAAKESYEEAGLLGKVHPNSLGDYHYEKRGSIHRVRVFLMWVDQELNRWPERGQRQRRWMPLEEAAKRVEHGELRRCLRRVHQHVKRSEMALAA